MYSEFKSENINKDINTWFFFLFVHKMSKLYNQNRNKNSKQCIWCDGYAGSSDKHMTWRV